MNDKSPIIVLDASGWAMPNDFYEALLPKLGAPLWHGHNVNALVESMIYGGINSLEPPYIVKIIGLASAPVRVRQEVGWTRDDVERHLKEFRNAHGHDVGVTFVVED